MQQVTTNEVRLKRANDAEGLKAALERECGVSTDLMLAHDGEAFVQFHRKNEQRVGYFIDWGHLVMPYLAQDEKLVVTRVTTEVLVFSY